MDSRFCSTSSRCWCCLVLRAWYPWPVMVAVVTFVGIHRLDACTGVGALLIRSKPFSVLKARPPELKQGLTARAEDASVP